MKSAVRRLALVVAFASCIVVDVGSPPGARALASQTSCLSAYASCLIRSKSEEDPVRRSAIEFDCNYDVLQCLERQILG